MFYYTLQLKAKHNFQIEPFAAVIFPWKDFIFPGITGFRFSIPLQFKWQTFFVLLVKVFSIKTKYALQIIGDI